MAEHVTLSETVLLASAAHNLLVLIVKVSGLEIQCKQQYILNSASFDQQKWLYTFSYYQWYMPEKSNIVNIN